MPKTWFLSGFCHPYCVYHPVSGAFILISMTRSNSQRDDESDILSKHSAFTAKRDISHHIRTDFP